MSTTDLAGIRPRPQPPEHAELIASRSRRKPTSHFQTQRCRRHRRRMVQTYLTQVSEFLDWKGLWRFVYVVSEHNISHTSLSLSPPLSRSLSLSLSNAEPANYFRCASLYRLLSVSNAAPTNYARCISLSLSLSLSPSSTPANCLGSLCIFYTYMYQELNA